MLTARVISIFGFGWMLASPATAAEITTVPDFSGQWGRYFSFAFEPPASGPGPVGNIAGFPRADVGLRVGDYKNPILKPKAADVVKKRGEMELTGASFPDPRNQCRPEPPPFILGLEFEIQILQREDKIDILYVYGPQDRRIRMNASHPTTPTPSWYGDSVGHFEGDTLVIDTVGFKVGPLSMVDIYGTPHSAALHLVERYRLVDRRSAVQSLKQLESENRLVVGGMVAGIADPKDKGPALQVQFTVEDDNVFTMPWSAAVTYLRDTAPWLEVTCGENNGFSFGLDPAGFPHADKPDF
jgi:hypothetical protein